MSSRRRKNVAQHFLTLQKALMRQRGTPVGSYFLKVTDRDVDRGSQIDCHFSVIVDLSIAQPDDLRTHCTPPESVGQDAGSFLINGYRPAPTNSAFPLTSAARVILISTPIPLSAPSCSCSRLESRLKIASRSAPFSCNSAVP